MLARDRLGPVESSAVEIDHRDRPGLRIGVHAGERVVAARTKLVRIGQLDIDGIAGELGVGADEVKAASLAHRAAAAVASDEPAARKVSPAACTVTSSLEATMAFTPKPRRISTPMLHARAARTDSSVSISTARLASADVGRRQDHFVTSMSS